MDKPADYNTWRKGLSIRKNRQKGIIIIGFLYMTLLFLVVLAKLSSAIVINSVDSPTLKPGEEGQIRIEIKNIFSDDAQDITLSLDFKNLQFIPIGSSEQSTNEITSDDEETFTYVIKASQDIKPGDYEIPYTLQYTLNEKQSSRTGTMGIKVESSPDLSFSASTDNPIIGQQGKITLKVVNAGLSEAKFVSLKILPQGFTLLSQSEDYIGTINSDDFSSTTFNVIFNKENERLNAIVQYKDFDNNDIIENIDLPIIVYTQEQAIQLGLIKKSNFSLYIGLLIVLVLIIIFWRMIKKRRRLRKSMNKE